QGFSGEVSFVPDTFADAVLRLEVDARALTVLDDVKEKDRLEIEQTMFNEVLEISKYPEIVFQSSAVTATRVTAERYKVRVIGNLMLHGVTRNGIWITAQATVSGEEIRAQGDFTLKQTDYNIKPVSIAAGALKLKDEMKFTFDLIARKQ